MALIIDELLCFIISQADCLNRENLISEITEFYTIDEICKAKQTLITEFEKYNLTTSIENFKTRRQTSRKDGKEKCVTDIFEIWQVVDKETGGQFGTKFVCADPNRLPTIDAEKYSLKFLISEILNLKEQVSMQKTTLDSMTESLSSLNNKLKDQGTNFPPLIPTTNSQSKTGNSSAAKKRKLSTPNLVSNATPVSVTKASKTSALSTLATATTPAKALDSATFSETGVSMVSSFKDKVENLKNDSKPWSLVTARKNKNVVAVSGKGENCLLQGVEKPKRDYWEISVTRLSESTTTADKIKTCLQGNGVEVHDVYVFNSRIKGCKSAKVRVALQHKDKVKDEQIWPMFTRVQDWIYKPRSARNETPAKGGAQPSRSDD
jgi:hypothetical protein